MKTHITTHRDGSATCALTEPVPGRKRILALLMKLLCAAMLLLPALRASAGVVITSLHSFQSFANGKNPNSGLVQGSDGNFHGTTWGGGTSNADTVFKINGAGVLTTFYSFTGSNGGSLPSAGLVQGSDGNFYGTTSDGGANGPRRFYRVVLLQ